MCHKGGKVSGECVSNFCEIGLPSLYISRRRDVLFICCKPLVLLVIGSDKADHERAKIISLFFHAPPCLLQMMSRGNLPCWFFAGERHACVYYCV